MGEHATNANYQAGCRCDPCRLAHNEAGRAWYQEQRRLTRLAKEVQRLVHYNTRTESSK